MAIKAPKEENLRFGIQHQKYNLKHYKGTSIELQGMYHHSETDPSLVWVEENKLFFCSLFSSLENIKDGMIIQIYGEAKERIQKLPSGKEQTSLALDVQKKQKLPIMDSYEFKERILAQWQDAIMNLMAIETGIEDLTRGKAEVAVIQRVMYAPKEQQWIVGAYLHPPQNQTGSAIYIICDKTGKPVKQIVSRIDQPITRT
ncbi:MAG: hypothetical protein ACFFBD_03735 [Candidatus Hodarchaeota archaeon]